MDDQKNPQTSLKMPPELSGPLPRKVGLSESSRIFPILVGILLTLCTIGCLLYGEHVVRETWQRATLRRSGVDVKGQITQFGRTGRGPDVVHYTFAANGATFTGMSDVPRELVRGLQKANTLTVRYIPSNPKMNHPAGWEWSLSSELLAIFILVSFELVIGGNAVSLLRSRQVVAWGNPAAGVVTGSFKKGRGAIMAKYEFRTAAGTAVRGSDYSEIREIGTPVWVLYLPEDPKRSVLYPNDTFYLDE